MSARLPFTKQLNFLTTNVNGLCANTKQTELTLTLHRHDIDIAVITETHLHKNVGDIQVFQRGYQLIRRDQNLAAVNKSKGGGIIIYVKNGTQYFVPNICVPNDLEVCWCIINPSHPESLIVAGVYIPPDANSARRQVTADHLIETLDFLRSLRPRAKSVFLGDFNP